jgi:sigma-B regulation protein RsbU (phosphoserine phosphatase)
MSQTELLGGLADTLAVGVHPSPLSRPKFGTNRAEQESESRLAAQPASRVEPGADRGKHESESKLTATPLSPLELSTGTHDQELESQLAALQKDYADLHAGLFEASQVYRRLCAPRLVRHGHFEIASETFAARHLPGDFIAVRQSGGCAMLALGDISGKGLAAGMWTPLLLGLLGIHLESTEPETIVTAMNRDLCRASIGSPLASLFLARLNSDTGILDYCSAGHPPALLLGADGHLESLSDGGPLLGAVSKASFAKGSVKLRDGDMLVAYSDGILEAHNSADEEFGFDRLEAQVRLATQLSLPADLPPPAHLPPPPGASADAVLFSVLGAVQDFVGGCPQGDDLSLVIVRRHTP